MLAHTDSSHRFCDSAAKSFMLLALDAAVALLLLTGCTEHPGDSDNSSVPSGARDSRSESQTSTSPVRRLEHDFGSVKPRAKLEKNFEIVNDTEVTWNLKEVHKSCSCILADVSPASIPPGKSGQVRTELTAGERATDVKRSILLVFQEKQAPQFELVMQVKTRNGLEVSPSSHSERLLIGNTKQKFSFRAKYTGDPGAILRTSTSNNWLTARAMPPLLSQKARSGTEWIIECEADFSKVQVVEGAMKGALELRAEHDGKMSANVTVPVIFHFSSLVEMHPSQVFFGDVERGQSVTRSIRIGSQLQHDLPTSEFELVRVKSKDPIDAKCERINSSEWRVDVTFSAPSNAQPGLSRGSFEIHYESKSDHNAFATDAVTQKTATPNDSVTRDRNAADARNRAERPKEKASVSWVARISD